MDVGVRYTIGLVSCVALARCTFPCGAFLYSMHSSTPPPCGPGWMHLSLNPSWVSPCPLCARPPPLLRFGGGACSSCVTSVCVNGILKLTSPFFRSNRWYTVTSVCLPGGKRVIVCADISSEYCMVGEKAQLAGSLR